MFEYQKQKFHNGNSFHDKHNRGRIYPFFTGTATAFVDIMTVF